MTMGPVQLGQRQRADLSAFRHVPCERFNPNKMHCSCHLVFSIHHYRGMHCRASLISETTGIIHIQDQEHIEPAKPAREHATLFYLVYTVKSKHGCQVLKIAIHFIPRINYVQPQPY